MIDTIRTMIAELTKERDEFRLQANLHAAKLEGKIESLQELLERIEDGLETDTGNIEEAESEPTDTPPRDA